MLNELLLVERGVRQAGIELTRRHPDVTDCGKSPTLIVRLDVSGKISTIQPMPSDVKPWRLCDGKHNSFPFIKPSWPFLKIQDADERIKIALDSKKGSESRDAIIELGQMGINPAACERWPNTSFQDRLRQRKTQLDILEYTRAGVVTTTIDRFLIMCADSHKFLSDLVTLLAKEIAHTGQDDWIEIARSLLIGKLDTKEKKWKCSGALLLESEGLDPIYSRGFDAEVSNALNRHAESGDDKDGNICGLTGDNVRLLSGNFPQPTVKIIGSTYLFSKNKDIRAAHRYKRFAANAMPVGHDMVEQLSAALMALTADERKGVTWQSLPGEASKPDLLLAFVQAIPECPAIGVLTDEPEDDFSEEVQDDSHRASSAITEYEKRTERLINAIRGKVGVDFRKTPVNISIFRKVDTGNSKVVYAGTPTVADLYDSARAWADGERNLPEWLTLPVFLKGQKIPIDMGPVHVSPLSMIRFSKQVFIHGGIDSQEAPGISASEALSLFVGANQQRINRVLRIVLTRRSVLVAGTAHAWHARLNSMDLLKKFDCRATLCTAAILGLLLYKVGRTKEAYMNETAFKLGQFLSAADIVHAGYCADVRGGKMPPSLLGNQVFVMAQTAPVKALAVLTRRWKPYDGWVKKTKWENKKTDRLDIKTALRHANEMKLLSEELAETLPGCPVDDAFRAELLLGYIAGFPKKEIPDNICSQNQ